MNLSRPATIGSLVGLLVLCFAVAATGAAATSEAVRSWYPTLDKPPWTPPNWAFGPIWTVLYASMAVAAWDVLRKAEAPARPLALFGLQLLLNAAWSPVFFAAQLTGPGLAVIGALWLAIAACIAAWWPISRFAAALMVPYLVWVSIATSLNAWIWWFNP